LSTIKNDYILVPGFIARDGDISLIQRLILAKIHNLQSDTGCYASNEYFAGLFGVSKRYVSTSLNILNKKGYIEFEFDKKNRRYINVRGGTNGKPPMEQMVKSTKRTDVIKKTIQEVSDKFISDVNQYIKDKNIDFPDKENFISYWTEPNSTETKIRRQEQRYFDIGRRISTWQNTSKKFTPKPKADIASYSSSGTGQLKGYCDKHPSNGASFFKEWDIKKGTAQMPCCGSKPQPKRKVLNGVQKSNRKGLQAGVHRQS
tara:strand:- start:3973 stop:4749 length:777 start_codon:yes stop_codon:yes gene_type:complete